MAAGNGEPKPPLRQLVVPVYLPAAIYSIGVGAVTPIVAVAAYELGASLPVTGLVAGLPTIGKLLADAPAGRVVTWLGERTTMILAALVTLINATVFAIVGDLAVLAFASLMQGASSATFELARHTLLTHVVEPSHRGRALGMLAGMARLGMTVGPFLAAALIPAFGVRSAYWVQIVVCVTVIVFLAVVADPPPCEVVEPNPTGGESVFRVHAGVFARLGTSMGTLMMLRMSRQIIVPLWGIAIGLNASHIALAVGVSGAMELALFYTGGSIADRFGRIWVAVPVVLSLSIGHFVLVLAHDLTTFFAATILLGLGNAFGGGIMMILGSDLAPRGRTAEFLGAWRVFSDAGGAVGPLVITVGMTVESLAAASVGLGLIGLVGSWSLYRYLPVYLDEGVS